MNRARLSLFCDRLVGVPVRSLLLTLEVKIVAWLDRPEANNDLASGNTQSTRKAAKPKSLIEAWSTGSPACGPGRKTRIRCGLLRNRICCVPDNRINIGSCLNPAGKAGYGVRWLATALPFSPFDVAPFECGDRESRGLSGMGYATANDI
ncbi:MAG: hypothetical protein ACLFWL_05890 [Candidatus Brocadiia bacterium]